jgi:uncharacterized protein (DUF1015 family)
VPDVRPLRALRYDPSAGELARLLCPPYDVLSTDDEEVLRTRHPRNYVRLILPRDEEGADRYRSAAATLTRWRADGTLRLDTRPAFYFYEQEYRMGGSQRLRRRGVFALVRLHEFSDRIVRPHELTLPGPREDRHRLLEATQAHLDPIFGLYSDPRLAVDALIERHAARPPVSQATDTDGVVHRLWMSGEEQEIDAVRGVLAERWILIADGHHRYESALRYARSRPPASDAAPRPFDYVLMVLCNIEARGLTVLPIHRLIHSLPGFDGGAWLRRLEEWFERRDLDLPEGAAAAARRIEEALAPQRGGGGALALAAEAGRAHLLTLRPGLDRDRLLAETPERLRRLDVSLVHTLALERGLSIGAQEQLQQTRVRYSKSGIAAMEEVLSGRAQAAIFLNPTPIEAVVAATEAGLRMPPKSTFFHPKLISGLVIHPFGG